MESCQVLEVDSPRLYRQFYRLPARLYAQESRWVPPLWSDERRGYQSSNPMLDGVDFTLLLAYDSQDITRERPLGRLMVYHDQAFNESQGEQVALFGAYDAVNDRRVTKSLMDRAKVWAADRGLRGILGPINPVAEFWGVLIQGFDESAMFLTPYNYRYYHDNLTMAGLEKAMDLYAYQADAKTGYTIPHRYQRFRELFFKRNPGFSLRSFDLRRIDREADAIYEISNIALAANWGYVPVSREVMGDMVKRLRPIIDPRAIWFVEDQGRPVGFCLGWPDFNLVLEKTRGRLLPFGWTHLLTTLPRVRDYRLFGLAVLPEYHGRGLDALLYMSLYEALAPRGIRLEANWILENNHRMNRALVNLGLERTKTYRLYRDSW